MKGWEKISKEETPKWILDKAKKEARKPSRKYGPFTFHDKRYKYFIESLSGADGYIAYRKLKYGYRLKEEKKRLVHLLIVAVVIIVILAVTVFFLVP